MNQTFTFADRLKSAMEQKHMKQVDLIHAAETAGVKVGKSHISQYVSGKTVPRRRNIQFHLSSGQIMILMQRAMWKMSVQTIYQA